MQTYSDTIFSLEFSAMCSTIFKFFLLLNIAYIYVSFKWLCDEYFRHIAFPLVVVLSDLCMNSVVEKEGIFIKIITQLGKDMIEI